jgi:glycerol-3-phosphate dehydrogenase
LTENIQLAGGTPHGDAHEEASRAATDFGVGAVSVEHLMATYGGNYRVILELTRESEELRTTLVDSLPHIGAEVVYAARYEMAATVEDFLSRRSRIELLARDHGRLCAMRVASLLERELGWSPAEKQRALAGFVEDDLS